uniref:Uncharacterized protein n=1 Tax=Brugia malayi TaxID=6279 RepID=A8PTW0_BRUMA
MSESLTKGTEIELPHGRLLNGPLNVPYPLKVHDERNSTIQSMEFSVKEVNKPKKKLVTL